MKERWNFFMKKSMYVRSKGHMVFSEGMLCVNRSKGKYEFVNEKYVYSTKW